VPVLPTLRSTRVLVAICVRLLTQLLLMAFLPQ
jgi:hypothetical protein